MRHPLDRNVGSDLSNEVFELRRRRGELPAPELNEINRDLYSHARPVVQRQSFATDRPAIVDSYQGDARVSRGRG